MYSIIFMVVSNLVVPLITGLFFMLYFLYFLIANTTKTASYRFFMFFLIGFSVFNFGRPLQLILGPHPLPLIIVNIRVFILCIVISPSIMLAANVFRKRGPVIQKREIFIMMISVFLGLIYVIFNTLGTHDSYIMFQLSGLNVYDNLTPSMSPPYFAREVTIGVQIVIGLILLVFSSSMLVKLKLENTWKEFLNHKIFLINCGILIFALSFIYGSIARQWWVYYAASVFSALMFGWSVLKDIKEVYDDYENLIPFIKEDILNNVAFSESSRVKLKEMLHSLRKISDPDTFMIVKIAEEGQGLSGDLKYLERSQRILKSRLDDFLGNQEYLILPLSNYMLGILLKIQDSEQKTNPFLLDRFEKIMDEIGSIIQRNTYVGIGRSYIGLEHLHVSYMEAQNALAFAETLEGSQIIHVENIVGRKKTILRYPVKEKERLLGCIKVGDMVNSEKALNLFLDGFEEFIRERPENLRVRLYELIGSLIDASILAGGDEDRLNLLASRYFKDIERIVNLEPLRKWLTAVVVEIVDIVSNVYESRSKVLIDKARKIIEEKYSSSTLSYKEVAREIFISPSYFLNRFKQETGETFVDYLKDLRIGKAKDLLLNSNKSIAQIAMDVGFNNPNYFSTQFTRTVGVTAKEYRKKWEEKNQIGIR